MVATAHVHDIFIKAPPERVWAALVDADDTERYFFRTRIESSFRPGERFRYVMADDADAIEGEIETIDPPHRLVLTWRFLYDAELAEEPPGRVEWTLTPVDGARTVTRVTLRHGDLALSPRTWAHARLGWVQVIDSLKSLLETGEPLPAFAPLTMPDDPVEIEGHWHRAQAVTANNSVWEYLDGRRHTADEADELLSRAYAAAYHWNRATGATTVNRARASWLLSRAHATLGHGEVALHHARQCERSIELAGDAADDFDHAYAHEARARALACLGRDDEARQSLRRARAVAVADEQDRAIVAGDLDAEPWYGLAR